MKDSHCDVTGAVRTDCRHCLRAERDAARVDAAREHERAESEYETVDAVALILTEIGRPDEEEIADGVRWLVTERDRLRAMLREVVEFMNTTGDSRDSLPPEIMAMRERLKAALEE